MYTHGWFGYTPMSPDYSNLMKHGRQNSSVQAWDIIFIWTYFFFATGAPSSSKSQRVIEASIQRGASLKSPSPAALPFSSIIHKRPAKKPQNPQPKSGAPTSLYSLDVPPSCPPTWVDDQLAMLEGGNTVGEGQTENAEVQKSRWYCMLCENGKEYTNKRSLEEHSFRCLARRMAAERDNAVISGRGLGEFVDDMPNQVLSAFMSNLSVENPDFVAVAWVEYVNLRRRIPSWRLHSRLYNNLFKSGSHAVVNRNKQMLMAVQEKFPAHKFRTSWLFSGFHELLRVVREVAGEDNMRVLRGRVAAMEYMVRVFEVRGCVGDQKDLFFYFSWKD